MDLVEFVVAREEWEERQDFEEDTAHAPNVHFVSVVAVSHQTFRRSVPPGRNVLRQWRLAVEAAATAQVCQFDCISREQDVFAGQHRKLGSGFERLTA